MKNFLFGVVSTIAVLEGYMIYDLIKKEVAVEYILKGDKK